MKPNWRKLFDVKHNTLIVIDVNKVFYAVQKQVLDYGECTILYMSGGNTVCVRENYVDVFKDGTVEELL